MRNMWWVIAAATLIGCGGEPLCGVDEEKNDIPICTYDPDGIPVPLQFCPGDQWGAVDGCNSCACRDDGQYFCTTIEACPGA